MKAKTITQLIDELIRREGGYVNHPADRGGPTNWGITEAVARNNGFRGDMRQLPRETAVAIYRRLYWDRPNFSAVALIAPNIAAELFDTGVNMGPAVAATFLQRMLNALNRGGRDYDDLVVDGAIGPATLGALRRYFQVRGKDAEIVLMRGLEALQGHRYITLAEAKTSQQAFLFGWLLHRIEQWK